VAEVVGAVASRDATLERVTPQVEPDGGSLVVRPLAGDAPDGTFFDYAPLHVGDVVLRVGLPSPRCAVPGLAQPGALPADPAVLPAIAAAHRIPVGDLGTYATLGV